MSLTDRLADTLRALYDRQPFDGSREQEAAREVLAEYDASRAVPVATSVPQVGQRVRLKDEPDEPSNQGVVAIVKGRIVTVFTDDDGELATVADELEVIPNLPAPNTGD